jgi:hypothetical protein
MSRRTIFAGLAVLAITALTLVAIFGPDRNWDRTHSAVEVVRVVDDQGNLVSGANTIIIERGGPGFFPFGIFLIPLGILFFIGVLRLVMGGRPFGGPGAWGGDREARLAEWHRRQHEDDAPPPATPSGTTA